MTMELKRKRIVLGVTGGIAALALGMVASHVPQTRL